MENRCNLTEKCNASEIEFGSDYFDKFASNFDDNL